MKDDSEVKDYDLLHTDMTRKQFGNEDDLQTPSRTTESFKDDNKTTERKSTKKPTMIMMSTSPVERSMSHRMMQVRRPNQLAKNNYMLEQASTMSERHQANN